MEQMPTGQGCLFPGLTLPSQTRLHCYRAGNESDDNQLHKHDATKYSVNDLVLVHRNHTPVPECSFDENKPCHSMGSKGHCDQLETSSFPYKWDTQCQEVVPVSYMAMGVASAWDSNSYKERTIQ